MMKLIKNKQKLIKWIFNINCIYLLLQPIFDILSNLYNNGYYSINIITYLKPLFVFGVFAVLFLFVKFKSKGKYFLYYFLVAVFLALHSYLLYYIFVDNATIFHELRFTLNIMYFITMFFNLKIIYDVYEDKKYFWNKLKNVLYLMICLYIVLYLIAVLSGTSWLTYEFADSSKLGYRGWYYSGQIFGHFLSISAPFFVFKTYESKIPVLLKVVILSLFIIPFLLIGTKVPYFIILIVFAVYILVSLFYKLIHRDAKLNWVNILISLAFIIGIAISYSNLPVYTNMQINNGVSETNYREENVIEQQKKTKEKLKKIEEKVKKSKENSNEMTAEEKEEENRLNLANRYDLWTTKSLEELNVLYATGDLHSSDNRDRQLYFMYYKFKFSTVPFKTLGLGYINQPNELSMERDIVMPIFSFGILGFILFTGIFWLMLFKLIIFALNNIKRLDKEFIFLAEAFCMFFFISFYAGATYIYTQFGNVLAIMMVLLQVKMNSIKKKKDTIKALNTITTESYDKVVSNLENNLKQNNKAFIITANPETIMLSQEDSIVKDMLFNDEVLKVPDGIAVVKACQSNGMYIKGRITGCDLSVSLLELANKHKKSLYLFGAKEEVLNTFIKVIERDYPNIKLLKAQNGYVKDREKVKKEIIKLKPDICLVALGIPHQEKFINKIFKKVDKGIYMGVGGTFDVLSGTKKRAPKIFIKLNLEWLYRIICEPFRIKRFIKSNLKFLLNILI